MYHVPLLYVQMRKKFLDGSHTHMHKSYLWHSKIQVEDDVFPSIRISQHKSFFLCMRASSYDSVCGREKNWANTDKYCSNVLDQDVTWFLPIPGVISSTGYRVCVCVCVWERGRGWGHVFTLHHLADLSTLFLALISVQNTVIVDRISPAFKSWVFRKCSRKVAGSVWAHAEQLHTFHVRIQLHRRFPWAGGDFQYFCESTRNTGCLYNLL